MNTIRYLLPFVLLLKGLHGEEPDSGVVDLTAVAGPGRIGYEETVSIVPVRSEWEAPAGRVEVRAAFPHWRVPFYGKLALSNSLTDVEQWREEGRLVQENDLTYIGSEIGAGIQFPLVETSSFRILPRLGGVLSVERYERDHFIFLVENSTLFNVDQKIAENVLSAGPSAGISIWASLSDRVSISLETEAVWLVHAEAENEGFDVRIEDGEGWVWDGRVSLLLQSADTRQHLGLSLHASIQEITGDVVTRLDGTYEWPDNRLEEIYLELQWVVTF